MIQFKHLLEIEAISMISVGAVVAAVIVMHNNQNLQQNIHAFSPLPATNDAQLQPSLSSTPMPTSTPIPQVDTVSQISPYGDKEIIMNNTHNSDGTITHAIFTADGSGNNQKQVYTVTLPETDTLTIPFNAWSANDTYFFILKNNIEALVFSASGATFANGEAYLDATSTFDQRNTGYILQEATGWASDTLLILNTTTSDNAKGPSYWFEVPSKAIIRLSTEF